MKGFVRKTVLIALVCFFALGTLFALGEEHYFGDWTFRRDGTHRATCIHCDFLMYADCSSLSCVYEGRSFEVCPVCGHHANGDGVHVRCGTLLYDYSNSPIGDVLVIKYDLPFGKDSDIVCAYSVIFEYSGGISDYDGIISVSIAEQLPTDLELLADTNGELAETNYIYTDGILTFNVVGNAGLFLVKKL